MGNFFNMAIKQLQEENLRYWYGEGYAEGYLEGQRVLKRMQIKDSIKEWENQIGLNRGGPGMEGYYSSLLEGSN